MSDGYELSNGIWQLITATRNGGTKGTDVKDLLIITRNFLGHNIPPAFIDYIVKVQYNQFGSLPDSSDIIPCSILLVLFFIAGGLHLTIYIFNYSRGHYFHLSLGWVIYCLLRCVGWLCRIVWAKDITKIDTGIASEIFMIIPSVVLVSLNLILAQRIFAWRHPVGGSRKLFWTFMNATYCMVLLVIGFTVFVAVFPFYHFLSKSVFKNYRTANKVSSILVVIYSVTSLILLGLAYFFNPAKDDKELYTYQPWWLESFSPLYFTPPGAAQEAAKSFITRNGLHRHAPRVIASTHGYYNVVKGLSNQRGDMKHNISLAIITISTIFIFIGAVCRAIAIFQDKFVEEGGIIYKPIIMYVTWGILEVIINILYIVGRVDLRFYKPDRLAPLDETLMVKQSDESTDLTFNGTSEINFLEEKIPEYSFQDCGSSDFHF